VLEPGSDQVVRVNIQNLIPHGSKDEALAVLARLSRAELLEPYQATRIDRDGRTVHVTLTATALANEAGEVYAVATTERAGR
jgi:two-component system, chemotaxis family, CheB/CheR fusion protein